MLRTIRKAAARTITIASNPFVESLKARQDAMQLEYDMEIALIDSGFLERAVGHKRTNKPRRTINRKKGTQ